MANLQHTVIGFQLDGQQTKVDVVHNLSDLGLDIEAAFDNWTARTEDFTSESFAAYVASKDTAIFCKPTTEFDKFVTIKTIEG